MYPAVSPSPVDSCILPVVPVRLFPVLISTAPDPEDPKASPLSTNTLPLDCDNVVDAALEAVDKRTDPDEVRSPLPPLAKIKEPPDAVSLVPAPIKILPESVV